MNKIILLLAVIAIGAAACQKKIDLQNSDLAGVWQLQEVSGGFANIKQTAATMGYQKTLELDKYGNMKTKKDGKLLEKGVFIVEKGKSMFSTTPALMVKIKRKDTKTANFQTPFSVALRGSDTLIVRAECNDCRQELYVRKRK